MAALACGFAAAAMAMACLAASMDATSQLVALVLAMLYLACSVLAAWSTRH